MGKHRAHRLVALGFLICLCGNACAGDGVDFILPDLNGKQHRLSDYRGKWVVVNFWATWCGPCLEEIPELIEFHRRHLNRNALVLGVNFEEVDDLLLEAFIEEQAMIYPVLIAGETPLVPFEPLKGLPATFIVSPNGTIAGSHLGRVTREALETFLAEEM